MYSGHCSLIGSVSRILSVPLQIEHEPRRILHAVLHLAQKQHGLASVHDAVVVGKRHVHHRAHLDLAVDGDRAVEGAVHAENGRLFAWGGSEGSEGTNESDAQSRNRALVMGIGEKIKLQFPIDTNT